MTENRRSLHAVRTSWSEIDGDSSSLNWRVSQHSLNVGFSLLGVCPSKSYI